MRNQNAWHSVELSKIQLKKKNKSFKISNMKKYLTREQNDMVYFLFLMILERKVKVHISSGKE